MGALLSPDDYCKRYDEFTRLLELAEKAIVESGEVGNNDVFQMKVVSRNKDDSMMDTDEDMAGAMTRRENKDMRIDLR